MNEKTEVTPTAARRERRDRREEILDAATRLLSEHGYQGATLSLVAQAVGLTEPGVLHYFPSKAHLLMGVLEYRDQQDYDKHAPLIAAENRSVAAFLDQLHCFYAGNEAIPELIQLFTVLVAESIRRDHPAHAYFVERYRRVRALYGEQFAALRNAGNRLDVDAEQLAALIMAVMDGLQTQWLLDPERVDMGGAFKLFTQLLGARLG